LLFRLCYSTTNESIVAGLAGPAAAAVPQAPKAGPGTAIESHYRRECFHRSHWDRWHRRWHGRWCVDERRPQHDGKGSSLF
jgi:hypothetical protein